ncbi:MAG: tRNA (N(6)-L-threonylcarbamoyladenosine(37)-C(2))-methylthiotransferase MtaB [Pyramidobacter sp.]|jgi:threonylcarbamoyladenosine tRNA methylthiotransferase MtaB
MNGAGLPLRKSDLLSGKKIVVQALGCRTNLAEAEALASEFEACGAQVVNGGACDAAVILTCSVTSVADRKSRQLIYRYRRENPKSCIVVCGCWAQGADEGEARKMGVSLLVGNRRKSEIPRLLAQWFQEKDPTFSALRGVMGRRWDDLELTRSPYFGRAFIKVQDGCDHRCTYCIVPLLRGPSVSRPLESVVAEARRCVSAGQCEVILTGVHLGLYGRDIGSSLAEAVRSLSAVDGVRRLRFGSLEPFSIGDDLLEALAESKAFCHHLHLPLQSGDDEVLRRMGRGHSAEDYLNLVRRLRSALGDDLHVSTDVMCAFPGETEQAFSNTLSLLDAARIGRVHSFRYSPRPGTPAADFPRQVPLDQALARNERLKQASRRHLDEEARRWTGKNVEVLFEGTGRGLSRGYTREYFEFHSIKKSIYNEVRLMTVKSTFDGVLSGD